MLHLAPQLLNLVYYWCHHMAPIQVEENNWMDARRCSLQMWLKHLLDSEVHHLLVHPGVFLAAIHAANSQFFFEEWEFIFGNSALTFALEDHYFR